MSPGGKEGIEMKKLEDAGTQLEHVPGVDETDHTEVTSCLYTTASMYWI